MAKNPADLTLRNLRAALKRHARLTADVKLLKLDVKALQRTVVKLLSRIQ